MHGVAIEARGMPHQQIDDFAVLWEPRCRSHPAGRRRTIPCSPAPGADPALRYSTAPSTDRISGMTSTRPGLWIVTARNSEARRTSRTGGSRPSVRRAAACPPAAPRASRPLSAPRGARSGTPRTRARSWPRRTHRGPRRWPSSTGRCPSDPCRRRLLRMRSLPRRARRRWLHPRSRRERCDRRAVVVCGAGASGLAEAVAGLLWPGCSAATNSAAHPAARTARDAENAAASSERRTFTDPSDAPGRTLLGSQIRAEGDTARRTSREARHAVVTGRVALLHGVAGGDDGAVLVDLQQPMGEDRASIPWAPLAKAAMPGSAAAGTLCPGRRAVPEARTGRGVSADPRSPGSATPKCGHATRRWKQLPPPVVGGVNPRRSSHSRMRASRPTDRPTSARPWGLEEATPPRRQSECGLRRRCDQGRFGLRSECGFHRHRARQGSGSRFPG